MQLPSPAKAVLIDLAGVLHIGDQVVSGAVEALAKLRKHDLPVRFLTNTSRSPGSAIVALLRRLGFTVTRDEILTAARATRELIAQRGLRPHYLIHPALAEEMGPSNPDPDVVVLGDAGPHFTFDALNTAFRLLMRGLPLIAMARNRYFREASDLTLDAGAFVAALEYAAGVEAEVVGKPARPFFDAALDELGVEASDVVLVGDDLHDDIGGAQNAGIAGILVRTGKYRPEDESDRTVHPACVVDDFAAAVEVILGLEDRDIRDPETS